ncbi:ABC transporter permease subunit [Allobranchiibius huperziae]|uniref:ABC-2 type transport system permease protein n=1 Tax=Allobranchiibius huperziae TaxID=1874116 RepID=A0A853DC18_9MICO|nr:ABC transporter permease subunit [Allobranchiibius huperziae]NYJ73503.1 ABC-2 type transport system permease protein [Allobranchiibius huperziae]
MNEIAATRRGVHDRLAELPPGERAAFRPGRTLSLRVEFVRQLRRRRTQLAALLLIVLPVIVAIALKVNNPGGGRGGGGGGAGASGSALITLGSAGAANFAFYTEFASAAFLLVVIVALFCGDTVASEASWSSLRYLLAIPVPRSRLLRQKLVVALSLSLGANLLVPVWSFLIGGVFFGWAPAQSPLGGSFGTGVGLQRLLIVVAYASLQSLLVAALAFLLSVLTDAPLGAVGGAVLLVVVSNILDAITALGSYRNVLPTHFQYSWLDALGPSVNWDGMIRGTGVALTYSAVFLALAWWRFERKDIVS